MRDCGGYSGLGRLDRLCEAWLRAEMYVTEVKFSKQGGRIHKVGR